MDELNSTCWGDTVDWVTLSTQKAEDRGLYLDAAGELMKIQDTHENHRPILGKMHGYNVVRNGHIATAKKEKSSLLMVDGWLCDEGLHLIKELPGQCTRIDLAVTVEFLSSTYDIARKCYERIEKEEEEEEVTRQYSIIMTRGGGSTLGIGRRKSGQYGRLYDKSAQVGMRQICTIWRYEVEFKKDAAEQIYNKIVRNGQGEDVIASIVWRWFAERMVEPVFTPTVLHSAIELRKVRNGSGQTLKWLQMQVAPAINRLIKLGALSDVEDAIGAHLRPFNQSDFNTKGDYSDGSQ